MDRIYMYIYIFERFMYTHEEKFRRYRRNRSCEITPFWKRVVAIAGRRKNKRIRTGSGFK